jgi:hypothetical protein
MGYDVSMKSLFMGGVALGALSFVAASYVLHCGFGMGPWPCQREGRARR